MHCLRVGMAQANMLVGDFSGNRKKIIEYIEESKSSGVDLLTFPELAVCGYPPEDLLFKPQFISENKKSLKKIINACQDITVVIGFVDSGSDIYNAAAVIHNGKLVDVYHKMFLPNYGVFDENRYFRAGEKCSVYELGGTKFGVNICEDIWYEAGLATTQAYSGSEIIVNISASPYNFGKGDVRDRMLATRAADNVAALVYCNMVGGQDELVFDGNSLIVDETGKIITRGKQFEEDLVIADIDVESVFRTRLHDPRWRKESLIVQEEGWRNATEVTISDTLLVKDKPVIEMTLNEPMDSLAEIYKALVLGTRDYIHKNDFQKVVIGLSGGIDSSLVAAIAVDALGEENVGGVSMPSRYSSKGSKTDAEYLSENLNIKYLSIPIERGFTAYLEMTKGIFTGTKPNVAEENFQARIRGNLLMAISNKFGWLVLTTGNKSEMAVGYATLYGDMAGGFAVIKDVPKTMVYDLCRYRNTLADAPVIPVSVIDKPPSAELRPDQEDSDSLPPYEVLDPIITAYVEEDKSVEQIISLGFNEEVVRLAARLIDGTEYKRRQAPPGVKITPRAFGRDRRLPITNRFKG
ncbi:NAD+ synthase [Chloroflexota bacterium]